MRENSDSNFRKIDRLLKYRSEIVELKEHSESVIEMAEEQMNLVEKDQYDLDKLNETIRLFAYIESLIRHIRHERTRNKLESINLEARELEPIKNYLEEVLSITENAINYINEEIAYLDDVE